MCGTHQDCISSSTYHMKEISCSSYCMKESDMHRSLLIPCHADETGYLLVQLTVMSGINRKYLCHQTFN